MSAKANLFIYGLHGPFRDRAEDLHANACVTIGSAVYLLDCGATIPTVMATGGATLANLTGVLITHVHGDHVGGLEELAFRMYYQGGRKLPIIAPETLWEDELFSYLDQTLTPFRDKAGAISQNLAGLVAVTSLGTRYSRVLPFVDSDTGFTFRAERVVHVAAKPAFGYLMENPLSGAAAWWSGDAIFNEEQVRAMADRCQLLFHDCSFGVYYSGSVHAHLEQLQTLPEKITRKIVLIHTNGAGRDKRVKDFRAVAQPGDVFAF